MSTIRLIWKDKKTGKIGPSGYLDGLFFALIKIDDWSRFEIVADFCEWRVPSGDKGN